MKSSQHEKILANLRLNAIWPAMADLIAYSQAAQKIIRGWDLEIRLGVVGYPGDQKVGVFFQDPSLKLNQGKPRHRLKIQTLTHPQLNRLFENQFFLPLVSGSFLELGKLSKLKALSTLLENFLDPSMEMLSEPDFTEQHARTMLGVLMRALVVVAEMDSAAQKHLQTMRGGVIHFRIDDAKKTLAQMSICSPNDPNWSDDKRAWLEFTSTPSTNLPDVLVVFDSSRAFIEMIQNKLDFQAAVGLRRVKVEGLLPLLDGLSVIMEQTGVYLNQLQQQ